MVCGDPGKHDSIDTKLLVNQWSEVLLSPFHHIPVRDKNTHHIYVKFQETIRILTYVVDHAINTCLSLDNNEYSWDRSKIERSGYLYVVFEFLFQCIASWSIGNNKAIVRNPENLRGFDKTLVGIGDPAFFWSVSLLKWSSQFQRRLEEQRRVGFGSYYGPIW